MTERFREGERDNSEDFLDTNDIVEIFEYNFLEWHSDPVLEPKTILKIDLMPSRAIEPVYQNMVFDYEVFMMGVHGVIQSCRTSENPTTRQYRERNPKRTTEYIINHKNENPDLDLIVSETSFGIKTDPEFSSFLRRKRYHTDEFVPLGEIWFAHTKYLSQKNVYLGSHERNRHSRYS